MKALNVLIAFDQAHPQLVGRLLYQNRRIYFEYDADWLKTGFALSPYQLPLSSNLIEDKIRLWQGLHGVFNDSLPDGWGMLLIDRQLRKEGIEPHSLMPLDRLAWLGHRTMGALIYEPVTGPDSDPMLIDIHEMAQNASQIHDGTSDEVLPELFRAGGSPGGARPKALIAIKGAIKGESMITADGVLPAGYTPWLVKFNAKDDFPDSGKIEYAYSLMAKKAGLDMPDTQLLNDQYFAVRRFDRAFNVETKTESRLHIHTLGNMIGADFRMPSLDYADLFKVVSDVTRDRRELLKAFRQMLFNIATHNRDDHSKNFAFVWNQQQKQWMLTPAYDLMFSNGVHGEHTMTVAGEGKKPSFHEISKLAKKFTVENELEEMLEQVNDSVSEWSNIADQVGISARSKKTISSYLAVV